MATTTPATTTPATTTPAPRNPRTELNGRKLDDWRFFLSVFYLSIHALLFY
jgi:hypothetical protein